MRPEPGGIDPLLDEGQLHRVRTPESVRNLAGGIAHDFNNLLQSILGYSELVMRGLPPGDPLARYVAEITSAGERAAKLTSQLLAFGGKLPLDLLPVDLNALVADCEPSLREVIGPNVRLVVSLGQGVAGALADAEQVRRILHELATNARDAMPDGGELRIETANVGPNEHPVGEGQAGDAGAFVRLTVGDTGVGMDAETQARIFDPFFTTKAQGKGTGLGLAAVHGIVRGSGGSISVTSFPGAGTTVAIDFPMAVSAAPALAPARGRGTAPAAETTVLVVDDVPAVCELTATILERQGYRLLKAHGADEALRIAASHAGEIDLLLTDVLMPGMNGRTLAERIRAIRPETRATHEIS